MSNAYTRNKRCEVRYCKIMVKNGTTRCLNHTPMTEHERNPPLALWHALDCLHCGERTYYRFDTATRARVTRVPPCQRCGGFCTLEEDKGNIGGRPDAHLNYLMHSRTV